MRARIRDVIAGIAPFDTAEDADRRSALDWIDSGAPLCRTAPPDTPPIHLVSYFAVVDRDHLLLVDHRKAGLWLPPGGHVEPGEHPQDTARREAREELGIAAEFLWPDPLFLTVQRTVGASRHTDVSLWYVLRGDRGTAYDFDRGEFHGIRWFAMNALPLGRSEPQLHRFAAKLQSAERIPAIS